MGWYLDLVTQVRRILPSRFGGTGNDHGAARYLAVPMRVRTSGEDMVRGNVVHCFEAGKANLADDGDDDVVGVVLGRLEDSGIVDEAATATQNELVMVVVSGITQVLLDEDVVAGEYAFPSATAGTAKGETAPDTASFGRFLGDGSAGGLAMVKLGGGGGGGGTPPYTDAQVEATFYLFATGDEVETRVPWNGTIVGWEITGDDAAGSAVVDVWVDDFASYPPTVADTITASAKPTLTTAVSGSGSPTGWTTALTKGDRLIFHVDSVSIFQRITVTLVVDRSS